MLYRIRYHILCAVMFLAIPYVVRAESTASVQFIKNTELTQTTFEAYDVFLNTGDVTLNLVEGEVRLAGGGVRIARVNTGQSVLSFWIEQPTVRGTVVSFKGASAGGISTNHGRLFTLLMSAETSASSQVATLAFFGGKGYLNDGKGTVVPVVSQNVSFVPAVFNTTTSPEVQLAAFDSSDTVAPSDLVVSPARSTDMYSNQWFLVFNAHDNVTGIDRYEVQESISPTPDEAGWRPAVSPFVLTDQSRKKYIHVRVFDKAGNSTVRSLTPTPERNFGYAKYIFWCILLVICLAFTRMFVKKKPGTIRTAPPPTMQ